MDYFVQENNKYNTYALKMNISAFAGIQDILIRNLLLWMYESDFLVVKLRQF